MLLCRFWGRRRLSRAKCWGLLVFTLSRATNIRSALPVSPSPAPTGDPFPGKHPHRAGSGRGCSSQPSMGFSAACLVPLQNSGFPSAAAPWAEADVELVPFPGWCPAHISCTGFPSGTLGSTRGPTAPCTAAKGGFTAPEHGSFPCGSGTWAGADAAATRYSSPGQGLPPRPTPQPGSPDRVWNLPGAGETWESLCQTHWVYPAPPETILSP